MTPQPAFQPQLAPQAPKCMYDSSYMCFLCFYLFIIHFYPRNTCMSNCTCVSYVFIHLLYFLPSKCVYEQSHMRFLVNTCMQVVVFNKIL